MKQKQNVLVIDDDQRLLDVTKDLLERHGYGVTACQDSDQVIPLVKANTYGVVLLDIRMPGIEGTELLPLIKKIRPNTPVILVSAYINGTQTTQYAALGAFDVISKPFSHEVLLNAVTRAIEQEEAIPLTLTSLSLREGRDHVYRKLILTALLKTHWNQVKASKLLGVSRYSLIRWMKKLGISY